MNQNIVLCSDGTGNRGGKGNGTNVWRIYNAIDQRSTKRKQLAFYDDGIGTDDNKYIKAVQGVFGWGFTRNVKDLYTCLARSYSSKDDHVYMFGFSRGAYTVRALAAFVARCGIITNAATMPQGELDRKLGQLVKDYHGRGDRTDVKAFSTVETTGPIDIAFIGVWDTVSAIGLPFDLLLQKLVLSRFKFNFRDLKLSEKVQRACHALALDDERRTFHPRVWDEKGESRINQVWFAGVHSNVGGGYPKQGMSYVSLEWMVRRVRCKNDDGTSGLLFEEGFEDEVKNDADEHNKLYDSRAGVAVYYRYSPRDVARFGTENHHTEIKIHESVFDRIDRRANRYNPQNIPASLPVKIVTRTGSNDTQRQQRLKETKGKRAKTLKDAQVWVERRMALHLALVLSTLMVVSGIVQTFLSNWLAGIGRVGSYVVLALFVFAFLLLAVRLRKYRYQPWLSLLAGMLLAVLALLPADPFPGSHYIPDVAGGLVGILLPDSLMPPVQAWLDSNPIAVTAAVLGFGSMFYLRGVFRRETGRRFEAACDLLRAKDTA